MLREFDRVVDGSSAITRLRQFVLDLAIRGKLVAQDAEDDSVGELLASICVDLERMTRGRGRRRPGEGDTTVTEPPFQIPPTWAWTRVADIGVVSPRNTADDTMLASFIPMALISSELARPHGQETKKWSEIRSGFTHLAEGDVGVAKITPCFENRKSTVFRNLVDGVGAGTTELHVVRPIRVCPDYLLIFFKSGYFVEGGIAHMTGTAGQKRLPRDYFASRPLPLPPLVEQHRIVAKVREVMALCDELEAREEERTSSRNILSASVLGRLARQDVEDTEGQQRAGRFLLQVLRPLTVRSEQVSAIRKAVRELAVRGGLVVSECSDESVDELLADVAVERDALLARDEIRPRPRAALKANGPETAFAAPVGWRWVRLGDLCHDSDAGWSPKCEEFPRSGSQWGVIKVSAVSWDKFKPNENKQLLRGVSPRESAQIRRGDFLISRANTSELVGKCVVVDEDPINLLLSDKIVRLRVASAVDREFVSLVVNHAAFARDYFARNASGTSHSMKNVSRDVIYRLPIPLPPVKEQRRIVARVEELMSVCDDLEAGLTASADYRSKLFDVLVEATLAGVA